MPQAVVHIMKKGVEAQVVIHCLPAGKVREGFETNQELIGIEQIKRNIALPTKSNSEADLGLFSASSR